MTALRRRLNYQVHRALERDRASEPRVEAVSRLLWRWRESRLLWLVVVLAALDYISTYAALELSGSEGLREAGLLAGWALERGGFGTLFLADLAAVLVLCLAAVGVRRFCIRVGFKGFGRAAFVVLLLPYALVALGAVANNLVCTFL